MKKSKWIGWEGAFSLPVNMSGVTWVRVMLRNGCIGERPAAALRWFHVDDEKLSFYLSDYDIVAYRVVAKC